MIKVKNNTLGGQNIVILIFKNDYLAIKSLKNAKKLKLFKCFVYV